MINSSYFSKHLSTTSESERSFNLDFLRGLFVLGILVYHIVPGAPVGLGQGSMECFFCLSGFLITKTLLRRIPLGWPGLRDFVVSRLRRLMPALLFFLSLVGVLNLIFERAEPDYIFKNLSVCILGFYNWLQVHQGRELQGLGGMWSLSVEDQFYMILILLSALLVSLRIDKKRITAFFYLYILFLTISLGTRIGNAALWKEHSLGVVSYHTPPRLWAFAWGGLVALIALAKAQKKKSEKHPLFLSPLTWLVFTYLAMLSVKTYDANAFLQGWLFCSLPIAVCILMLAENKPLLIFSAKWNPIFVWIARVGVACYPIYLFQEFELNFNVFLPWPISMFLAVALGFLVHVSLERKFYSFPTYTGWSPGTSY